MSVICPSKLASEYRVDTRQDKLIVHMMRMYLGSPVA